MKRVLCSYSPGAMYFIMRGWQEAFNSIEIDWYWWPKNKSSFDAFDEIKPDIVFLNQDTVNRATIKCLKERPETKVAIKCGNWGYLDSDLETFHKKIGISKEQYPVEIANDNFKKMVSEIVDIVGSENVIIYNLYHKNKINGTMDGWYEITNKVEGFMPAACLIKNKIEAPEPSLVCDIGFVGGYWPYKAINLNKFIIPLCNPVNKYNIKIFGNSDWPVPQWMGGASEESMNKLFSSAIICPNVSEPHANEFGFEVNERVFKLAAVGAFCISDHIDGLNDVFDENMLMYKDESEFHDAVHLFCVNPQLRKTYQLNCMDKVLSKHTYHDRLEKMFKSFNLFEIADKCIIQKEKILKEREYELEFKQR